MVLKVFKVLKVLKVLKPHPDNEGDKAMKDHSAAAGPIKISYSKTIRLRAISAYAIGGMSMTQMVGHVLTRSDNNHSLLFVLIPSTCLIVLAWVYLVAPRQPEKVRQSRPAHAGS
jgi:hypothetical protein